MPTDYTTLGLLAAGFAGLFALYKSVLAESTKSKDAEIARLFQLLRESEQRNDDLHKRLAETTQTAIRAAERAREEAS